MNTEAESGQGFVSMLLSTGDTLSTTSAVARGGAGGGGVPPQFFFLKSKNRPV